MHSLLLAALLVFAATDATAQPAGEARHFLEGQLSLGASAVDDLDFSTSWSLAGGLRILPRTFVVARLRHTSPFVDSLFYDLLLEELFELDPEPGVDSTRTHETDLSIGLRVRWARVVLETSVGAGLVYRIGNPDYDNHGLVIVDGTIGVLFRCPERGPERTDGWLFFGASADTSGDFVKAHAGIAVTHEFGD